MAYGVKEPIWLSGPYGCCNCRPMILRHLPLYTNKPHSKDRWAECWPLPLHPTELTELSCPFRLSSHALLHWRNLCLKMMLSAAWFLALRAHIFMSLIRRLSLFLAQLVNALAHLSAIYTYQPYFTLFNLMSVMLFPGFEWSLLSLFTLYFIDSACNFLRIQYFICLESSCCMAWNSSLSLSDGPAFCPCFPQCIWFIWCWVQNCGCVS